MNSNILAKAIIKAVLVIVSCSIVVYILYAVRTVIIYILIAGVIALIGRPVVLFLRRKLKFGNTLSVSVTMLLFLGLIVGLIALCIPVISEQGEKLAILEINDVQQGIDELLRIISDKIGASSAVVEELVEETDIEQKVLGDLDTAMIPSFFSAILEILSSISVGLFSIIFISFFFLKDSKIIQRILLNIVPPTMNNKVKDSLSAIKNLLSSYFIGLLAQIAILFTIYSIVLLMLGVENAMIIALVCSLFNIIPYIGPIIGGLAMLALALTSSLGEDFYLEILPKLGYLSLGITVGQLVDNFFSQPFIFSNSVKSHPLEIFLIIIMSGLLFGVVGMIIAVPTYTVVRVVLKEFFPKSRLVGFLTNKL